MTRPCPVIFDLDGTLIDSAPDIHAGLNRVLAAQGLAQLTAPQVRSFIGHGVAHLIAQVASALDLTPSQAKTVAQNFEQAYIEAVDLTTIYPNVRSALEGLLDAGHQLGICTNKPMRPTIAILKHLDLHRYFTSVIGGDSLPVRKPDPAPLIKALWELGDGGCLYVGDSEVDAATAHAAHIPFALVTHGYLKRPAQELGAKYQFDDFAQLGRIVAQENTFKG